MYAIEDFGCEIDYSEISKGGVAKVTKTPIHRPEDWYQLKCCSTESGSLARELEGLHLLVDKVKGEEVPVIFTIFSPLTIANKLSANTLRDHINEGHKEAIHAALKVITETTCNMAKRVLELGADGIFFAAQSSTYSFMSAKEYQEFGLPYDMEVLEAAKGGWMNTLHAHGTDIMVELLRDYPVPIFNWHAWETLPAVDEASIVTGKCLMGGLNRTDITQCNRNAVRHQIYECCRLLKGQGQILTPGCVIRYPLDDDMLRFIKQTKMEIEQKMHLYADGSHTDRA